MSRNIYNFKKSLYYNWNIVFRYYNLDHKIVIKIDTSNYIFKDIFFQYNKKEVLYLVVYFFKKHNLIECNYKIYNKKLITIVCAFEK